MPAFQGGCIDQSLDQFRAEITAGVEGPVESRGALIATSNDAKDVAISWIEGEAGHLGTFGKNACVHKVLQGILNLDIQRGNNFEPPFFDLRRIENRFKRPSHHPGAVTRLDDFGVRIPEVEVFTLDLFNFGFRELTNRDETG